MEHFTPLSALIGGAFIGGAASLLILANGRVAGVSGILGGLLALPRGDLAWRAAFVAGLIGGPWLVGVLRGAPVAITIEAEGLTLVAAGLLVGYGTRMGGGCTSGHGVCGIARFSRRSLAATATFMVVAAVTVYVTRHLAAGSP
jgi:uncharacterized membrane protein YedE/YeeE